MSKSALSNVSGVELALVHTHVPALFCGNQETHFTAKRASMAELKMVYYPTLHLISIRMPGVDHVLLGLPNVAYMKAVGELEGSFDQSVDAKTLKK